MKKIKLSDYAKQKSICYRTAWNRFVEGKLPNAYKDECGRVYVKIDDCGENNRVVIYARVKRGLFRTGNGKFINADVNGSYNIMKKAIPDGFPKGIEGLGVNPLVLTIKR